MTNKLKNNKKISIFGYGSLVNSKTRKITLKKNSKAIPVLFKDPKFTRKWICLKNNKSNKKRSVLTLCKNKKSKKNINGVLFSVNNKLLKKLNKRESAYNLIKLNNNHFTSFNNKKIPKQPIYSYNSKKKYKYPNKNCKVNQYYIDVTIDGLSKYGKKFTNEFNTTIKKKYIKNTRKYKNIKKRFNFIKKINTKKIDKIIKQINLNKN